MRTLRNQAGVTTVIFAVIILALTSLVTLYTARFVTQEQSLTNNNSRHRASFEAAEAGLAAAIAYIEEDPDRDDNDVAPGTPGEMIIRHSADAPRKGFFSGYLNRPEATAEAWRGGWFHTGDTVTQDDTGMVFFVDGQSLCVRR